MAKIIDKPTKPFLRILAETVIPYTCLKYETNCLPFLPTLIYSWCS